MHILNTCNTKIIIITDSTSVCNKFHKIIILLIILMNTNKNS